MGRLRCGGVWMVAALLLLCGVTAVSSDAIRLEAGTPVFAEPSYEAARVAVVGESGDFAAGKPVLTLKKLHPLARYLHFYPVTLRDGASGFADPYCRVAADGALTFRQVWPPGRIALGGLIAAGWGLLAWAMLRARRLARPMRWEWIALVVLARVSLLWIVVQGAGNVFPIPADEVGYFSNAYSFWTGDFSQPWHFTVGVSILYLPFIALGGMTDVAQVIIPFSYLSGFVLAPLMLVLGFLIAERLTGRKMVAFAAMGLWAVMPFFYHHQMDFASRLYVSFWDLPVFSFSFQHYINLIAAGFNAMSDVPSTLTMLLAVYLALRVPLRWWSYALLGVVFAFGCMLRINNIFFAPLLALLVWRRDSAALLTWRGFLRAVLPGAAAFLIGFAPQFATNWYFYGNPLLFSYTRYSAGAHTYFSSAFFTENIPYYGATNQVVWAWGIAALLLMRNWELRTVLCWWALPIIFFFFGYSHGTDDPIRFILTSFPALWIAGAACECWQGEWRRCELLWLLPALAAWLICGPNMTVGAWELYLAGEWRVFRPLGDWQIVLALVLTAASVLNLRKKHRDAAWFVGLSTLLCLFGNAYLLALLMGVAMVRALFDSAGIVRRGWNGANRV